VTPGGVGTPAAGDGVGFRVGFWVGFRVGVETVGLTGAGVGFRVGALVIVPIEPTVPDILDIELMDELIAVDDTLDVWRTRSEKAARMVLLTSDRPRMVPAAVASISNKIHNTFICRHI
jgi:hypothetical protein